MKNQRKTLAIALLSGLLTVQTTHAQSYTLPYDNPEGYKKLIVNFNLIELDLASPTTFRFGLGAEFNLNKQLLLHSDVNLGLSLFDFVDGAVKKQQTEIEAGGIFSFASKTKMGKAKFKFNKNDQGYRAKIDCHVLRQFGVRGGVSSFSTPKAYEGHVAFTNATSIYAGISIMRTKSFLVSIEDYGTHDRESRGKLYADVLFAPIISLADNTDYASYAGSASTATPANFPDIAKNHLGFRIGYNKRINRPLPMKQGFEAGIRPGIGNGMYFLCKIAISVGFIEPRTKKKLNK